MSYHTLNFLPLDSESISIPSHMGLGPCELFQSYPPLIRLHPSYPPGSLLSSKKPLSVSSSLGHCPYHSRMG